jgi:hypothetical protein
MFTVFQFIGIIAAAGFVIGSSFMEVIFTLAVCFVFNSCDFNFDWESHKFYLHPITAIMPFALPVLRVLHAFLSAISFLFISATTIYAMITVVEFFFVVAKRVLVYILKGRQMLSQLRRRPQQPVVVDAHNLLQPAMVTSSSSILRSAGATRRPHDRRVKFSATHDTTCVYLKGLCCPIAEQVTIVFSGASKLRDSSRRDIMAHYGMRRISQTYGTRHVAFDPAVEFTGRVTLEPLREMPIGILQPILEEEDDFGVIDMEWEPIEDTATVDLVVAEEVGGVVDMEVEPIQEAATVDCKEQELSEWMRIFCAIPTVSTPPAPAPAEKVEEVFVTVAVSRFVIFFLLHFLVYDFHLTLVFICSIPTLQLPHRLPLLILNYHLRMNKLISTLMIFRIE